MASTLAGMPVRIATLTTMACAFWCALGDAAWGQAETPRPPRVRTLFNTAREYFKRGDYESAGVFYAQAQAGQNELTPTEQRDLATQIAQNTTALQARRDGAIQLRLADEALAQGRLQDAGNLVKGLETNQYLAGEDKQLLASISQKVRATASTQAAKSDYRSLLIAARTALARGDYELAHGLTTEADKIGTTFPAWMQPWNDSPAKVRRDIQTARAKATLGPALPPPTAKNDGSTNPFQAVKNGVAGKDPHREVQMPPPPVFPSGEKLNPTAKNPPPLPPSELPKAYQEGPVVSLPPYPEIKPASATAPGVKPANMGNTTARSLVRDGYRALEAGDLASAQHFALEAKKQRVDFDWREENPDRLLSEIQRRQQAKANAGPKTIVSPEEARALVRQGRALLGQDKLEDADKSCTRAAACTNARWGLFEDSPDKLRTDVAKARNRRNREESLRLMVEARKLFQQGNLAEAKAKAWRAQQLHGPYGLLDLGDRPDSLLREIHRAELTRKDFSMPPAAKNNTNDKQGPLPPPMPVDITQNQNPNGKPGTPFPNPPGGNPLVSGPAQTANKLRAAALVREARELEMRGFLGEARVKAMEAAQLKASFGANEDSPEMCRISLAAKCDLRVKQLVKQASDQAYNTPTDPNRFQKALADLAAARKLAQSFGLDTYRIDQEGQRMAQAAAAGGVGNLAGIPPQGLDPNLINAGGPDALKHRQLGREKLAQARMEINAGNYSLGRKFAEEATHPMFGVQEEALAVIRSIDVEELNQRKLTAQRNADAGIDACKRGAFQQAASIFGAIDLQLLPPDRARRIADLMSSKEMQSAYPGNVVQAVNKDGIPVKDQPGLASAGAADDLTRQFRALEEIQFQQLRERGLTARRTALQRMNVNDTEGALTVLRDFLEQLEMAQLDAERKNLLKRPVDNQLQQYKTIQAQRILEKNQDSAFPRHNEGLRQASIHKTQKEVAELIQKANQFIREGKHSEAWALGRQAKELDPDNVAADAIIQISQIGRDQRKWDENKRRNGERLNSELDHDFGPHVTMDTPLDFNKQILLRSQKRDKNGVFSPLRNAIERQIESQLLKQVSFGFKDQPLHQVIEVLHKMGGVNMVIDHQALKDKGISLEQPITQQLENIGLKSALNLLLEQAGLTWVIENEVVKITTPEKSKGRLQQRVYSVADLVIPVTDHPVNPVYNLTDTLARTINNNQGGIQTPTHVPPGTWGPGQSVSSPTSGNYGGLGGAMSHGGQGVNKTNPTNTIEDSLMNLITNTVQQNTWSQLGGPGTIQYFPLGHALIVNQTQEVQEEVLALLQSLRRLQDLEVAIEVKLVQVADSFFERIGVDFDLNILTPKTRFEQQLLTNQFQPQGFVNRFRPDRFVTGLTPAGSFTSDLNVPIRGSSFDFSVPPFGNFPGSLGNDGGFSLGLAFLSDIQVFMFMEAAQGSRRLNVMQAPRITVFNGQTATITVQDQIFFLTSVQPTYYGNTLAFFPNNQPFPVGMFLTVNPVVSADRRFVRMFLQPQITGISGAAVPLIPFQTAIPTPFDNPLSGGGQSQFFQMFFQQPQLSVINLGTTVNVPDGGTVLLGGIKVVSEGRSEFGAPLLGKIPYLSRLFRNVGYGREAQSLMIMVTPRIIINEEEEQIYLGNLAPIPRP